MHDDEEASSEDDSDGLLDALFDGDAERAGIVLQQRTSLSRYEIELLADLLLGSDNAQKSCSHRLVFERWGPGRPRKDPIEEQAASQARGRQVARLIQGGMQITAAQQLVSERQMVSMTIVKRDWRKHKARQDGMVSKPADISDQEST